MYIYRLGIPSCLRRILYYSNLFEQRNVTEIININTRILYYIRTIAGGGAIGKTRFRDENCKTRRNSAYTHCTYTATTFALVRITI